MLDCADGQTQQGTQCLGETIDKDRGEWRPGPVPAEGIWELTSWHGTLRAVGDRCGGRVVAEGPGPGSEGAWVGS